jgi:surface polysaccharide O-acyltransferase-like enzyme
MTHKNNIHRFRSIAIIGIVVAHSLHNFIWSQNDLGFRMLNVLANESSVWFFTIAGFLFQRLGGRFEYRGYLTKKAKNILLPYVIVSIPALIASLTFYDQGMAPGFADASIPTKIFLLMVTGKHLAPLWFVPTICLIFLITPVLLRADTLRWPYLALIVLMPLSAWLGRDGVLTLFGLDGNWSALSKAVYLLSTFVFGMMCSRYHTQVIATVARWKWPLLAATIVTYVYAVATSTMSQCHGLYVFKMLCVPLLLYALQSRPAVAFDRISFLGDASFGIFFLHCYFLAAFRLARVATGLPEKLPGSALNVTLLSAATLALSVLSIHALQRSFGARCKLLIGCNITLPKTPPWSRLADNIIATLQVKMIVAAR